MDPRDLLKPLPFVLVLLFLAVAVGDLVQTLTEEPTSQEDGKPLALRFQPEEPILDFRASDESPTIEILPIPEFESKQWSAATPRGVWAKGKSAELTIDLAAGGHRNMILDCLPGGGKRPVRSVHLTVNQVDCGEVTLHSGWGSYRIKLPHGALRSGPNRLVFSFRDRADARKSRRALLVRRLALEFDDDWGGELPEKSRPIVFDGGTERIVLGVAGTLEIPLHLNDRTDALRMRYRFSSNLGRAEVAVVQVRGEDAGVHDAVKTSVSARGKLSGNVRIPLHGRRGAYVLRIRGAPGEPGSRLLISSLRLIEEGDPTGRPWSANPLRD
jgi:hypothetical protein